MNTENISSWQERESQPYTQDELQNKIDNFLDYYDHEKDSRLHNLLGGNEDKDEIYRNMHNALHEELLQDLLKEKERFAKVFRTKNGSYYFQLINNQVRRIKFGLTGHGENTYHIEPQTQDLIFTTSELEPVEKDENDNIYKIKVHTADYGLGVIPVEFGLAHHEPVVIEDEGSESVLCSYQMPQSGDGGFRRPIIYHKGHPIVEIIR